MLKHIIELPGGSRITSGAAGTAIVSVALTQTVNSGQELTLGSVCAAMAELELLTQGDSPLGRGDRFTLYQQLPTGQLRQVGIFTAEEPQVKGLRRVKLTAYDNVARLDQDLTDWVRSLTGWPYDLQTLAGMVCDACGLTWKEAPLPNGEFCVDRWQDQSVTGRQILSWIGQICGRFLRADPQGNLEFAWYAPKAGAALGPTGGESLQAAYKEKNLTLSGSVTGTAEGATLHLLDIDGSYTGKDLTLAGQPRQFYYRGSLSCSDYAVAPVERVRLRQTQSDIGTVYPDTPGQKNTYCITGNPLLATQVSETLLPVAKALYDQLAQVSYTPCTVTVSYETDLVPGDIVQITDSRGKTVTAYIMQRQQRAGRNTLICTGSGSRESTVFVNNSRRGDLSGKVLQISAAVEGLAVENADARGNLAAVRLDVEGISGTVTAGQTQLETLTQATTVLRQDARQLELELQSVRQEGVRRITTATGYSFSEDGLQISKSGQQMENRLDHTGMYVSRSGQPVLTATNAGVTAVDVTVDNYFRLGSHARFEDYPNGRTACFYIQEGE